MPSLISLVYRTANLLKWGSGKGSNLRPDEYDNNNWTIAQAILSIQHSIPDATIGIDYFSIAGDQLTVHMSDHTLRGPYTLPTFQWTFRNPPNGAWQPVVVYDVGDVFTANGSVYLTLILHTSAGTFDAHALDGFGHNLYGLLLTNPGDVLPVGGARGMALTKIDGHDFFVEWSYVVPTGGATGQYLAKINNFDFAMHWVTPTLEALGDVAIVSPLNTGDALSWNGSHWQNATLQLELSLSDVIISGQSVGQVLAWDGIHWKNTTIVTTSQVITALGTSGSVGLDPLLGDIFTITPAGDVTLSGTSAGSINQIIKLIITTSGASSHNITFGSGFKSQGVLATGTVTAKTFIVTFINDGNFYYEMARTTAMS